MGDSQEQIREYPKFVDGVLHKDAESEAAAKPKKKAKAEPEAE